MAEIELKFSLPRNQQKRALSQLKRKKNASPPANKELDAIYFDTPLHELHKVGLTLRVRSENGTCLQTVKREGEGGTASLLRDEFEDEVHDTVPDLTAGKSGRAVRDVLGKHPDLRPLFRVRVTRTIVEMRKKGGGCVEAALDRGEIETVPGAYRNSRSDRRCPIHELELELKHGSDTAWLFDVALSVSETVPLRIETLSKAERGYELLEGSRLPKAVLSPKIPMKRHKTLGAALGTAGRVYLEQFRANIPAANAEEVEGIHQMRIALRRLRAVLSFAKEYLPKTQYEWATQQLKSLLQALGAARNWDVLRQTLNEVPDLPHRRTAAHHQLLKVVDKRSQAAHNRASRGILSPEETVAVLQLSRWFEDLARPGDLHASKLETRLNNVADKLLDRQFKRVCKRAKGFEKLDADDRHKLRIACKNLRYNAELFGQLYTGRKVNRFVKLLKPAQDGLGVLNDVQSAHKLLMSVAREKLGRAGIPVGEVLGWLDRGAIQTLAESAKAIRRLRNAPTFW